MNIMNMITGSVVNTDPEAPRTLAGVSLRHARIERAFIMRRDIAPAGTIISSLRSAGAVVGIRVLRFRTPTSGNLIMATKLAPRLLRSSQLPAWVITLSLRRACSAAQMLAP